MIADATPNANTVWIVLIALASFLGNVATIFMVFANSRKQKREVSFSFQPASEKDFEEHKTHNNRIHDILFAEVKQINASSTVELKGIGERVAGLESSNKLQNQTLAAMNSDIKTILGRLPRQYS